MIRQHTYLDHYEIPPEGFTGSANMSRTHVDHCIESLRPRVMCAVDVTLVPFRLEEDLPLGAVPVLTKHVSRNLVKMMLIFEETPVWESSYLWKLIFAEAAFSISRPAWALLGPHSLSKPGRLGTLRGSSNLMRTMFEKVGFRGSSRKFLVFDNHGNMTSPQSPDS